MEREEEEDERGARKIRLERVEGEENDRRWKIRNRHAPIKTYDLKV